MKLVGFILCVTALAQSPPPPYVRLLPETIGIAPHLRSTSPQLRFRFTETASGRDTPKGPSFFRRILFDDTKREYFGYEFLVQPQQTDEFLASFGPLGVTTFELTANMIPGAPRHSFTGWSLRALPTLPEPRVVHSGDTLSIELFADGADKLTDELTIDYHGPAMPNKQPLRLIAPPPPVPTVSGAARDFSAADTELQLLRIRVSVNGDVIPGLGLRDVRGPLPWIYLPGRGRYVFSLIERPGLHFVKAGEARGGALSVSIDGEEILLECPVAIAPGDAAYFIYVLRDREWQPVAENQKSHAITGTVGLAELTALQAR